MPLKERFTSIFYCLLALLFLLALSLETYEKFRAVNYGVASIAQVESGQVRTKEDEKSYSLSLKHEVSGRPYHSSFTIPKVVYDKYADRNYSAKAEIPIKYDPASPGRFIVTDEDFPKGFNGLTWFHGLVLTSLVGATCYFFAKIFTNRPFTALKMWVLRGCSRIRHIHTNVKSMRIRHILALLALMVVIFGSISVFTKYTNHKKSQKLLLELMTSDESKVETVRQKGESVVFTMKTEAGLGGKGKEHVFSVDDYKRVKAEIRKNE
jgi:hypothetical protein